MKKDQDFIHTLRHQITLHVLSNAYTKSIKEQIIGRNNYMYIVINKS